MEFVRDEVGGARNCCGNGIKNVCVSSARLDIRECRIRLEEKKKETL